MYQKSKALEGRTARDSSIINTVIPVRLRLELQRLADERNETISQIVRDLLWAQVDQLKAQSQPGAQN